MVQRLMVAKRRSSWQEFNKWMLHISLVVLVARYLLVASSKRDAYGVGTAATYVVFSAFMCFYAGVSEGTGLAYLCGRRLEACSRSLEWARSPAVPYFFFTLALEAISVSQRKLEFVDLTHSLIVRNVALIVLSVLNKRVDQAVVMIGVVAVVEIFAAGGYSKESAMLDIAQFMMLVVITLISETLLKRQTASELEAKNSRHVESSIEQMLCGVCDAVVHLRKDLALKRESQQLDALLLRGKGGSTRGSQAFLDLLHEDRDRDKFRQFVQQSQAQAGLPHTLHVAMRDSNQTPVPVQIFHTEYLDAADELSHIIGIREFGDGDARAAPQLGDLSKMSTDLDLAGAARHRAPSQDCVSELSSESGGVQALVQVPPDSGAPDEVAVWVHPLRSGLPMFQCTPEFFAKVGGPSLKTGTKLTHWIPRHQRAAVESEMQQRFNRLVHEKGHNDDGFEISLKPRHLGRHATHVHATLSLPPGLSPESSDDLDVAKITCSRLQLEFQRPRKSDSDELPQPGAAVSWGGPRSFAL